MAMPMQDYELIHMKDHIEIKRASLEDAETILHLQMHTYLSEAEIYNDYSIPPLIQTLGEIKQEFSQQVFLNAIEEGSAQYVAGTVELLNINLTWNNIIGERASQTNQVYFYVTPSTH